MLTKMIFASSVADPEKRHARMGIGIYTGIGRMFFWAEKSELVCDVN